MENKQELLDKVAQSIIDNLECSLKDAATNLVFGKGNPNSDLLFIAEAPGANEDLEGLPFVGKAGKDLDKHLNKIGLSLENMYIANILKYRPPKNRDPKPEEIENHTPYLVKQIEIIKPKIIVTLGNFSSKFILANGNVKNMKKINGVDELHGKIIKMDFKGTKIKVFPIHHPSSIIYSKDRRKWFEEDFYKLERLLFGKNRNKEIQTKLI